MDGERPQHGGCGEGDGGGEAHCEAGPRGDGKGACTDVSRAEGLARGDGHVRGDGYGLDHGEEHGHTHAHAHGHAHGRTVAVAMLVLTALTVLMAAAAAWRLVS